MTTGVQPRLLGIPHGDKTKPHLYVSGIALDHPGPAGYAYFIIEPGKTTTAYPVSVYVSTTRRAVLQGIIDGLEKLPGATDVVIHADSSYVVERYTENRVPAKNLDLWKTLAELAWPSMEWVLTAQDDENGDHVAELADLFAARSAEDGGWNKEHGWAV